MPKLDSQPAKYDEVRKYQFALETLQGEISDTLIKAAENLNSFLSSVLTTEQSHPQTIGMAEKSQDDQTLSVAINDISQVDKEALISLKDYLQSQQFVKLVHAISKTIGSNGRIFLSGCGSSGRLALLLEKMFRDMFANNIVIAVIAGGDFALVRAIEKFEDNKDYALLQLEQQNFNFKKDLYIGISASGSASYNNAVIEYLANKIRADEIPRHLRPWLVCCNNAKALTEAKKEEYMQLLKINQAAVSPHPLASYTNEMECVGLDTGPNALAGSSRMQSATVTELFLFHAIMQALIDRKVLPEREQSQQIDLLIEKLSQPAYLDNLKLMIQFESETYQQNKHILYRCSPATAITTFTELTERSPTFGLAPYNNLYLQDKLANFSLEITHTSSTQEAFEAMLGRKSFSLNWNGVNGKPNEPKTLPSILEGFNFSQPLINDSYDILDINLRGLKPNGTKTYAKKIILISASSHLLSLMK